MGRHCRELAGGRAHRLHHSAGKGSSARASYVSISSSIRLLPCGVPRARAPQPNRADTEMCALHRAAPHTLLARLLTGAGGTASHAARMPLGWKLQSATPMMKNKVLFSFPSKRSLCQCEDLGW